MKLFVKITEAIECWMLACIVFFCIGGICAAIYQYFGRISFDSETFLAYIWGKGLYAPVLWPLATFAAIGWALQFHLGKYMAVAAILSAIGIIRDWDKIGKEEGLDEQSDQ